MLQGDADFGPVSGAMKEKRWKSTGGKPLMRIAAKQPY